MVFIKRGHVTIVFVGFSMNFFFIYNKAIPSFLNLFFIYFCLRWVFVAARGLSLAAESGGSSLLRCAGFSLWWLLLLQSTGSRHTCFSSCSTQAVVAALRP